MLVSLVGPCYVCLRHERLATTENPPSDLLRSFDDSEDQDDKELEPTGRHDPRGRLALVFFVARLLLFLAVLHARCRAIMVVILNHATASISYESSRSLTVILTKIFW